MFIAFMYLLVIILSILMYGTIIKFNIFRFKQTKEEIHKLEEELND